MSKSAIGFEIDDVLAEDPLLKPEDLTDEQLDVAEYVASKIDKPGNPKRWLVLVLATIAIFGPYYVFDNPAGTQQTLKEQFDVPLMTNSSTSAAANATVAAFNINFNLLYTLYSLPNTVMPLVGGYLVDRVGFRKMVVATTVVSGIGHLGFTISAAYKFWGGMWASRALFGIGTESLCVAQRILVAEWFMGRELALSMGIVLALGRLGSTVNDNISALFQYCVDAYWVGFGLCCVSILAAIVVTYIDAKHEESVEHLVSPQEWRIYIASRNTKPKTGLSDVLRLGARFWIVCGMILCCFPPVSSFNNISSQLVATRWTDMKHPATPQAVNAVVGILYAVSASLALVMGWVVDRVGTRTLFVMSGSLIVGITHQLIAFNVLPIAPLLVCIGIGFSSLAAAVWPEVAFVAPRECFGIAYGIAGAIQNSGLASVPAVVALLQPPACSGSYQCVEELFSWIAFAGAALAAVSVVVECFFNRKVRHEQTIKAVEEETKDFDAGMYHALGDEGRPPTVLDAAHSSIQQEWSKKRLEETAAVLDARDRAWASRRRSLVGGPESFDPLMAPSTSGQASPPAESFGEFLATTEHDGAPAPPAIPAAAGATTVARQDSATSVSNDLVTTAIWEYAAELALHGAPLTGRHYRPRRSRAASALLPIAEQHAPPS